LFWLFWWLLCFSVTALFYTIALTILYVIGHVLYRLVSGLPPLRNNMEKRAVLITGCDTGFGNALSQTLSQQGIVVFAGCLTSVGVEALNAKGIAKLHPFELNVTSEESVNAAVATVKDLLASKYQNEQKLSVIVNNAGVLRAGVFELQPASHWKLQLDVNVLGMALTSKAFMPLLRDSKGRIINVASVAGRLGTNGTSSYNASKFAVEGMSDSMRRELSCWGIEVVIIEPGIMKTPLWDVPMQEADPSAVWNLLNDEQKAVYGEQFFKDCQKEGHQLVEKVGGDPKLVVNAMVEAVTAKYPMHRYIVGYDAPVWILLASLPSAVSDFLLEKVVKSPLPCSLRK